MSGRFAASRGQRVKIAIPVGVVMVTMLVHLRRKTTMGRFAASGGQWGKTASQPIAIPLTMLMVMTMFVHLRGTTVTSRFAASGGQRRKTAVLGERRHDKPQQGNDGEKCKEVLLHFEMWFFSDEETTVGFVKERMRNKSATRPTTERGRKTESENGRGNGLDFCGA
jgi:uncharacterized membrane protein